MSEETTQPKRRRWRITRRGFLIGMGATAGTLALGVTLGRRPFYRYIAGTLRSAEGAPSSIVAEPFAWWEISAENEITLYVSKTEMGQGVHTAIAQIGAEELGVEIEQVIVRQADTTNAQDPNPITGGSNSVSGSYEPLRSASATLREMLKLRAAELMSVPAASLDVDSGTVFVSGNRDQAMTYGEIVGVTAEWPELDTEPTLKSPSEYKIIGQSVKRVDFKDKLTAKPVYGYDVRVEGMLYGAVARPPSFTSTFVSASPGTAAEAAGVVDVVIDEEKQFAGVVARTRAQAWAAVQKLDVRWELGDPFTDAELEAMLDFDELDGFLIQQEGSARRAIGDSPTLEAEYSTPFAAHAHLEPQAALAEVKEGKLYVYGSTQGQGTVKGELVDLFGMDEADVIVEPTYLGGGFGRRLNIEAGREAAILAMATGQPVHIGWTRPEDMRNGYYRPPTRNVLRGKVENGRAVAFEHYQASGPVAFPFFPAFLRNVFGTDFGSWRGSFNTYNGIENRDLTVHLTDFPIATGWWRSLGLLANVFAVESFMDEMAHAAGADPLQFRLDHLDESFDNQRIGNVLRAAAEKAGYGQPLADGHFHGVAYSEDVNTMVAMVAEVSVDEAGVIKVHKMTAAVDCGLVVNPDGAIAQTQGNIIWGLSSALIEEMGITNSIVRPANFDQYPLLTMDRAPEIDVVLVPSDDRPRGMGEPPLGPVAAAVGNAVFNATGKRLRRFPFTAERVLAA